MRHDGQQQEHDAADGCRLQMIGHDAIEYRQRDRAEYGKRDHHAVKDDMLLNIGPGVKQQEILEHEQKGEAHRMQMVHRDEREREEQEQRRDELPRAARLLGSHLIRKAQYGRGLLVKIIHPAAAEQAAAGRKESGQYAFHQNEHDKTPKSIRSGISFPYPNKILWNRQKS